MIFIVNISNRKTDEIAFLCEHIVTFQKISPQKYVRCSLKACVLPNGRKLTGTWQHCKRCQSSLSVTTCSSGKSGQMHPTRQHSGNPLNNYLFAEFASYFQFTVWTFRKPLDSGLLVFTDQVICKGVKGMEGRKEVLRIGWRFISEPITAELRYNC
jgi:hypothetical protein